MNRLRTSLMLLIVSLFVLTGYGIKTVGACCEHRDAAKMEEHGSLPDDSKSSDVCKCVHHQSVTPAIPELLSLSGSDQPLLSFVLPRVEFPPDTEPSGIDYPPQLSIA